MQFPQPLPAALGSYKHVRKLAGGYGAVTQSLLMDVDFNSSPSGTTYTGAIGSVAIDVTGTDPSPPWEHVSGGGWGGGGAVRFYGAPTGGGVYRGFTPNFNTTGYTQINIRWMQKWNSNWAGTASGYGGGANNLKGNYIQMGGSPFWTQEKDMNASLGAPPAPYFQLAQSYSGTLYRVHGGTMDSGSDYTIAGSDADSTKWGDEAFLFGLRNDEWVCFEYEFHTSGTWKIYIWTSDRDFNGAYMEARDAPSGTLGLTGLGGMYFHDSGAASGSWIMCSHFAMAESLIGPPSGF